jgi:hypothetical protein
VLITLVGSLVDVMQLRRWSERRNEELVEEFKLNTAFLKQHQLVFIDETGKSGKQLERRRGRGPRGCRPRVFFKRRGARGSRCNAIAAMTCDRVLPPYIHPGSSNGDIFLDALKAMVVRCSTYST